MDEQDLAELLRRNPHLKVVGQPTIDKGGQEEEKDLLQQAETMLESELQNTVRKIALSNNWLYYHTFRSKKSEPGFPDAVLLRVGLRCQLYFVEFKRQSEEPTDKQKEWLAALEAFITCAGGFAGMNVSLKAFVWRPMDLLTGRIEQILQVQETT